MTPLEDIYRFRPTPSGATINFIQPWFTYVVVFHNTCKHTVKLIESCPFSPILERHIDMDAAYTAILSCNYVSSVYYNNKKNWDKIKIKSLSDNAITHFPLDVPVFCFWSNKNATEWCLAERTIGLSYLLLTYANAIKSHLITPAVTQLWTHCVHHRVGMRPQRQDPRVQVIF